MSDPNTFLESARTRLAQGSDQQVFTPEPIIGINSVWLASSLLQKAIRRGLTSYARSSAYALLSLAPDRLWRRLICIAFEDIGAASMDTVATAVVAGDGKAFRRSLGGDWTVASTLVAMMAASPKCRAADDLLMGVERRPGLQKARRDFVRYSTTDLLSVATSDTLIHERALALWFAVGTNQWNTRYLQPRSGEPRRAFDQLRAEGFPADAITLSEVGFRRTGLALCPLLSLLCPLRQSQDIAHGDDEFPRETMLDGVPAWAHDAYVRSGKAAFRLFLDGCSSTAQWFRENVPPRGRVPLLGDLIFIAEGGLLRSRLQWNHGRTLRRAYETECLGLHDVDVILDLVRADLPQLHEARSHV